MDYALTTEMLAVPSREEASYRGRTSLCLDIGDHRKAG